LASPTYRWRWRAAGALAGFLVIGVVNVVRICFLYGVGLFLPLQFDFFHHELWPLLLIALAGGVFLLWSRLATSRASEPHAIE
jgi:exosortase/archaeosortase family protein